MMAENLEILIFLRLGERYGDIRGGRHGGSLQEITGRSELQSASSSGAEHDFAARPNENGFQLTARRPKPTAQLIN